MMRLVRVFLSHTSDLAVREDGRSFVQAALDAVGRAEMVPIDMRYFASRDGRPAGYCRDRVRDCDVFVSVVGFGYGTMVPDEKVSYTELEFDEAGVARLPRLVYLLDDPGGRASAEAARFRQRLRDSGLPVRTFGSDDDLERALLEALRETADPHRPPPPRELPPDVSAFTGRTTELSILDGLVARQSAAVLISAVSGTAGVGKTALALHWAHRVADRFPDGHLYVDLRGYDPDQPMSAADALEAFLRALGADIPYDIEVRAARYRSLVAGRRLLVVLDNASSAEQVRPLLPGSPSCAAVVTSRDSLSSLVAQRIDLDLLPAADAVALLRALVGERVDADPVAATRLAEQCARLPLALRVAAELAVARPARSLAALVDELTDEQRRLDRFAAGGDPRTAVRAVFSWSRRQLPAAAARAFALLGLHAGPDFDVSATAALTDSSIVDAERDLAVLTRAHLVRGTGTGRYAMHDLLRAYAAGLVSTEDATPARARLSDHYLTTAAAAVAALYPAARAGVPPPADPRSWLDAERATLVVACARTPALAFVLFRYLDSTGHYADALTVHTYALAAARRDGDRAGEAGALTNLGSSCWRQGRYDEAASRFTAALVLFRELGDRVGEGRALGSLGAVHFQQGRYEAAVGCHVQALELFRLTGDAPGEARALSNLSLSCGRLGRFDEAIGYDEGAIARYQALGDRSGEAYALHNIGSILVRQGRVEQAASYFQRGLALHRKIGHRGGEAAALDSLGLVSLRLGRVAEAESRYARGLEIFREIGDRGGEAEALNGTGEVLLATGQPDEARARHTTALAMAVEIGDRFEQARAHRGLATAADDRASAVEHWQEALRLYVELGMPLEADEVRASLSAW